MASKPVLSTKTPITELQELCVSKKAPHPLYTFTGEEIDGGNPNSKVFTTSVLALGFTSSGIGRSKKDSKHDAAYKLLKLLFENGLSDIDVDNDEHFLAVLSSDKVTEVRDICVQRNFEMPEFNCVRSSGPSHAPEFEYECRIGAIVRRGIHKTKKGAKQAACNEMIKTLQAMPVEDSEMQVQPLNLAAEIDLNEDEHIIRTYRELINSDIKKKLGVKIADRHRFFEEQEEAKISAARRIALDETLNVEDKCTLIPKALGLKFEMKRDNSDLVTIEGRKLFTFELQNSEYDCFIFGKGDKFYESVYKYLKNMLNFDYID
ncbi:uncharacterized protein LOC5575294 [Aedes aegypti]|uniref:DRBM domain-containing protein n=1 Tax=Aedes aegypti TaxID=7159 RepID=A0A1S4FUL7_AEDAE|nr:uncharacterized protein LOC5575294 [Aedes aegypti]